MKWKLGKLGILVGIMVLLSCSVPFGAPLKSPNVLKRTASKEGAKQKRIVGYFVEWGIYAAHDNYYVTSIPFEKITHINYAFIGINPSTFSVEVYDPWASLEIVYPGESWDTSYKGNLGMLRKMKQQYPNIKVLISVGGWTKSHGFHAAAMTDTSRKTMAKNFVVFMKQHGMDGIDIDWEYPGINRPADPNDPYDKGSPGGPEDKANFPLLLKAIREELDKQGAADGHYYELTAAIGVGYDKIEVTDPAEYSKYLDALNLMTYDMHGGFESVIGHQAPLYANPYDTHESLVNERYNIDWAVQKFISLGVPAEKIVLGVPFYSRGWNNVLGGWDINNDGIPDGMFGTGGGTLPGKLGLGGQSLYYEIKKLEAQLGWEKFRDPYSMVPWLYNREKRELYTYDDAVSIAVKMDYILQNKLGGAMFWEFDGDDWKNGYDLINIIENKLYQENTIQDTVLPTKPQHLQCTGKTDTSVDLKWDASTDNTGIGGYEVLIETDVKVAVKGTSASITNLTPNTTYSFNVRAFNLAGNRSPLGAALSVTTEHDNSSTTESGSGNNQDSDIDMSGPATGVPGTPFLEQTKWNGEATFGLKINMWWGNNGTKLELFENDQLIHTQSLTDRSPNAQSVTIYFVNKPQGSYKYRAKLINRFGASLSNEVLYTVKEDVGVDDSNTLGETGGNNTAITPDNESGNNSETNNSTVSAWTPWTYYKIGDVVSWNSSIWKCQQAHTALIGWEPGNTPALWTLGGSQNNNSRNTTVPLNELTVPPTPLNIFVQKVDEQSITISWTDVSIASSYEIEADGVVTTGVQSPWTHASLSDGTTHIYRVRATNSAGASNWSSAIQATTKTKSDQGTVSTNLPKRLMSGYWHIWDGGPGFIKLRDVNPSWDIINIAFAEPVSPGSTDGKIKLNISGLNNNYDLHDFKNDIALLQSMGKKVVLSIGGDEGYFSLTSDQAVQNFVGDVYNLIDEYGFNGIDIDLEQNSVSFSSGLDPDFRNPTSTKILYMIKAIRQICEMYDQNFILSWAPETFYLQLGHQFYGGINGYVDSRAGCYIPMIYALRDRTTYVQAQLYNSGSIMGNDDKPYTMGTVEGIVAMCEMLLQGFTVNGDSTKIFPALRPDQVVVAVPASSSAAGSGQILNIELQRAFAILEARYSGIRGIMAWSINWDNYQNNNVFAIENKIFLNTLQ